MSIYNYSAGVDFAISCIAILDADFTDMECGKALLKRVIMPLIGILEKDARLVGDSSVFERWLGGLRLDAALAVNQVVNTGILAPDDAVEIVDRELRYCYTMELLSSALKTKKLINVDQNGGCDILPIKASDPGSWNSFSNRLTFVDMVYSLQDKYLHKQFLPKRYADINKKLSDIVYSICVGIIDELGDYAEAATMDTSLMNVYNRAVISLDNIRDQREEIFRFK
jgi:hypothetical protein